MKFWNPSDELAGAETPAYLERPGGAPLALVHHQVPRARATVVLAGPMSLERSHSYLTWVRWARTLALNGYEVWRFDYAGVGESLGEFTQQTFDSWSDDLHAVLAHARTHASGRVAVLGLRLGALLARRAFDLGHADALLAWDPPATGRAMLMDMLRRKLAADYMEFQGGEKKTRDDYVRELEGGAIVEVEGFHWSQGLWRSADAYAFSSDGPDRLAGEYFVAWLDGRPAEKLPNTNYFGSVRVPKPPFWLQSPHLVPDLTELFSLTLERLHAWSNGWRATDADQVRELPTLTHIAATSNRHLEVVALPAGRCVGTHHAPSGEHRSKLGVLWVNFGYVPRDGHGGLAAKASDELARQGVPCFRYDLPGLGDAPGRLPAHTQHFFPMVTSGEFTAVTSELVHHLVTSQQLDGLVIGGLCGGAVNAIFAADAAKDVVKGLILLEPEMYVTEPKKDDDETARVSSRDWLRARLPQDKTLAVSLLDRALQTKLPFEDAVRTQLETRLPLKHVRAKLFSYWGWMRLLTLENRYGRWVPLPRKAILDFVLSRSELPSVTNLPLTSAWQRWVQAQRPVLVITAERKLREVFFDRINDSVLSGVEKKRYEHVRLRNTNHIFTTGGAISTVTRHLTDAWPMLSQQP